jgi:NTE family protein
MVPLRAFETLIGPRHVLASAAIPLLFPAVSIGRQLYVDGGLKMNVPLAPALYLGADRVIVVSLRPAVPATAVAESSEEHAYATGPFLMGKALNALMADHTTQDLDRLRQINRLLEAGTRAYGSTFLKVMAQAAPDFPFRPIREILVHPSRDIGAVAADYVRSRQFSTKHRGLPGKVLRTLADREARSEAGLVSYLLFDRDFAELLWELGRKDAAAMRQQWLAFWNEPTEAPRLSLAG